jgi:hypothetical protein
MELHIRKEFTWPIDINKEGYENFNNLKERLREEIPEESFEGNIKIMVENQNPNINIIMQYHILTPDFPPKSKKAKISKF